MPLLYPLPKRTSVPADGPKTSSHSGCYYRGRQKKIRVIVVHAMQSGEAATTAETVGSWFQNPKAAGSAHKGADPDSLCKYVNDDDTAWGAPGVNADGLHMEHAGKSEQTAAQWKDDASLRIMENGAVGVAEWCVEYDIPARWLTDAQLRDGVSRGLTFHKQCSRVFGGSHWDPGPDFPFAYYLARVKFHVARLTAPAAPSRATAPTPTTTAQEAPSMFLVQLDNTDPVYKSDGFRRVHVTKAERDALLAAGVKLTVVKTTAALAAFGPEVV